MPPYRATLTVLAKPCGDSPSSGRAGQRPTPSHRTIMAGRSPSRPGRATCGSSAT